jgi:ATP-binding cassette subfamily C (CFTR/MRP) protein 5
MYLIYYFFFTVIILAITSTFVIFLHDSHIPAAMAGLAIAYASTISGSFQFIVRLIIELESKFLSVERLSTYISVRN